MYIERIKKQKGKTFDELNKALEELPYAEWKEKKDEAMYWRKANQIHNWFVNNIQEGKDDCGNYILKRKDVEKLLNVCKKVKEEFDKSTQKVGKVPNGQTLNRETGRWEDITEDGNVFENLNYEKIRKLLPTTQGFFFGSTNIDQWYLMDIKNTIDGLEKVLKETNFRTHYLYYNSSW